MPFWIWGVVSALGTIGSATGLIFDVFPMLGQLLPPSVKVNRSKLFVVGVISAVSLIVYVDQSRHLRQSSPTTEQPTNVAMAPAQLFDAAQKLAAEGDCHNALDLFRALERTNPTWPTLKFQMAYCFRLIGDLPRALEYSESAVIELQSAGGKEGKVQLGDGEYNLSTIRFAAGDRDASLIALASAIQHGFPFGCRISDPDLTMMSSDPRFSRLVGLVVQNGVRACD